MCLNGRVSAAAALAVTVACGGSFPPTETRPVGTTERTPHAVSVLVVFATAQRTLSR